MVKFILISAGRARKDGMIKLWREYLKNQAKIEAALTMEAGPPEKVCDSPFTARDISRKWDLPVFAAEQMPSMGICSLKTYDVLPDAVYADLEIISGEMQMATTGRCYCGELKYEINGAPQWQAQCHCRECQYISGGGPNYFMIVAADDFSFTEGTPRQFTRDDIDNPRTREFCGTCGTHMITRLPDRPAVVVKVGTLDDVSVYEGPQMAIFTCDMQPFHVIAEGVQSVDKLPQR